MCTCMTTTDKEAIAKILPPWMTYWKQIDHFFAYDDDVFVGQILDGGGEYTIPVIVKDPKKAYALKTILRENTGFGNVDVHVDVRLEGAEDAASLLSAALDGNTLCRKVTAVDVPGGVWAYAELAPEVIQFPNDDLRDANGNSTYIAQDIAREIFAVSGGQFCTVDIAENGEG